MTEEKAMKVVLSIHQQNGDNSFEGFYHEIKGSMEKYDNYFDWWNDTNNRTDLTQDLKWELDCFDESFKAMFALMGKVYER